MSNIRIPPPENIPKAENKNWHPLDISQESIKKYEFEFSNSLLEHIKTDVFLKNFYMRLIHECDTVQRLISIARPIDILELEEIVNNMTNAKNLDILSYYDSEFHKRIFGITGEVAFFQWWQSQSMDLQNYLGNLWISIGYKSKHYHDLIFLHNKIYQSIRDKNRELALSAMEDHFSIVLFHLLANLYKNDD